MDSWCDSGLCGEKVTWELLGDGLFIDGEGKMDDYLRNASVWEPLVWLVRSVVIGEGVRNIGDNAFSGFTALSSISIPDSVTEIGEGAFAGCASLKEITVSKKNPCYFFRDGMLIKKYNGEIIWPPEKAGKPLSRFALYENDCVFRIETGWHSYDGCSTIASFGDSDTLIEIRESNGMIIDIECIYFEAMLHESNLILPDYRSDPDLEETKFFFCPDYNWEERNPCAVNVDRNKMEIIFSTELDSICKYHIEGRVEYYCNAQDDVVMIRIADLTEEEYNSLR